MDHPEGSDASVLPQAAVDVFGERLPQIRGYAAHLATTGVAHGLIGPREVPRLWERHLLNCAVVERAIPPHSSVADVGSGAGLPGLVLAIVRPDLKVTLIEPLERRTRWLEMVVADLDLSVTVRQAKVETLWDTQTVDVVTARAVASLGELARMSLPLLRVGGRMVALKGDRAETELTSDSEILEQLGAVDGQVQTYGTGVVDPPTTAVLLTLGRPAPHRRDPVGDGPARTAARKKERRRTRAATRRHNQGR